MGNDRKRQPDHPTGAGTPSEGDRRVLKRSEQPVSADVPEAADVDGGKKIKPVDLSLHGDGITHWQDEPLSERDARRRSEGKKPGKRG